MAAYPFTLVSFTTEHTDNRAPLDLDGLEALFHALTAAERPRSFRVFVWILLRTLKTNGELHASMLEEWLPSEADLAQLLEDAGADGAQTLLALEGTQGQLDRLWQLCDDSGLSNLAKANDPWNVVSLAPMAALYTERQLEELISAIAGGRQWKDPAEILNPDGDTEFDIDALLCLAQTRMATMRGSGEALNLTVVRLLRCADRIN